MKLFLLTIILFPVLCNAQSSWVYSQSMDKMTSKPVYVAQLISANKLNFAFPYEGGSTAMIEVDNINNSNQIILSVSKGQFNTSQNGMNITVRFDSKKASTFRCGILPTNDINKIYIDADKKFISQMKLATIVQIEAEFYQEGAKVMLFDVTGFDWKH
jgi:hypothetical protein